MRSSVKKSLFVTVALAAVMVVVIGGALPAGALGPAGTLVFRGVATSPNICYPGMRTAQPGVNANCAPDTIGSTETRPWSLDIGSTTLDFCVGANSAGQVGVRTYTPPFSNSECDLKGGGLVKSGPRYEELQGGGAGLVGPYCGASHGTGNTWSKVGSTVTAEQVEWIQSAATVLPTEDGDLNNTKADDANGDGVIDPLTETAAFPVLVAGITDAIGSIGGNCGATSPSFQFNVIGVAVGIGQ